MSLKPLALCALVVSPCFAVDEYLAIPAHTLEAGATLGYDRINGFYDGGGTHYTYDDLGYDVSPSQTTLGLQLKVGLTPGLDFEGTWNAIRTNKDAGDAAGLGQPTLALKYAPEAAGAGLFMGVVLPFATGDFDLPGLQTGLVAGGLVRKRLDALRFTGLAMYVTDTDFENGTYAVNLKPEIIVGKVGFILGFSGAFDAEGEGYQMSIAPGLYIPVAPATLAEISVPLTIAGENASAGWGLRASLRQQFPL